MEKSWTNSKYSVNNEENHKDNDETIKRNDVKSAQLVTQLLSNNGVTLKTSSKQPQLAAKTTSNIDQKRASKSAAKKGKKHTALTMHPIESTQS